MNYKLSAFFNNLKGKKIALCGIGKSNLPLVDIFIKNGASVTVCDFREMDKIGNVAKELYNKGVTLQLGKDYLKNIQNMDIILRTPGMKFNLDELNIARENGVVVTSEMELFFDLCPCKIFAVTGSDGKTTTTTIISKILKASGKTVHLGGNIGKPLFPIIEEIKPNDVAVVELSSFQLISMRQSPNVSVITNLAPNHLDIHKDMAEYINAKKNIFMHQNAFSRTVLNFDNEITKGFKNEVRGDVIFFSRTKKLLKGVFLSDDNDICIVLKNKITKIMNANEIVLKGNHNLENYLAAIAAVWGYVNIKDIKKTAHEFKGVEHRSEFVREVNGVKYYNDSIASSPTRTASGTLSLYNKKIILIAGGYDKKIPFDELGPIIVNKVKLLILMGNTANKIEDAVKKSTYYKENAPKIIKVNCMEQAVDTAKKYAQKGDIVSLSPACASFDLYANFKERGDHFKKLVWQL